MSEPTPTPEFETGDFIRITWPNGSELKGFVHVSERGAVVLNFGPERDDLTRWMGLGIVGNLHEFVALGNIQVIPGQRSMH